MASVQVVILAAGKGKRMGTETPKPLLPIGGKPIIQHLVESVHASQIDGDPILVVSEDSHGICETFGQSCRYVIQKERLGTGHAVLITQEAVGGAETLVVLYGDHPFISASTLQKLVELHRASSGVMSIMTTKVASFEGWLKTFEHWGRILRDAHNCLIGIRQFKDAMESERSNLEVDPALYCFNTDWLWEHISQLKNFNAQGEYYLTDLVELAVSQGHTIATLTIPPEEAIGINTPEELTFAQELYRKRL